MSRECNTTDSMTYLGFKVNGKVFASCLYGDKTPLIIAYQSFFSKSGISVMESIIRLGVAILSGGGDKCTFLARFS